MTAEGSVSQLAVDGKEVGPPQRNDTFGPHLLPESSGFHFVCMRARFHIQAHFVVIKQVNTIGLIRSRGDWLISRSRNTIFLEQPVPRYNMASVCFPDRVGSTSHV